MSKEKRLLDKVGPVHCAGALFLALIYTALFLPNQHKWFTGEFKWVGLALTLICYIPALIVAIITSITFTQIVLKKK